MDLRQLRAFLGAYEHRSLTAAALRLNATQPGLSVQIAALEAELDAKLFERHTRGLIPTFAGDKFYPLAASIMHDINQAIGTIRSLSSTITGSFSIGVPPTLSKAMLAPVLSRFTETYLDVEIRVVEGYSMTLLPLLANGEIDCALVTVVADHPEIRLTSIYRDRFVLVSGEQLDLSPGVPVALDGPRKFKLVIPSLRHGLYRLLEPPLRTGRIAPERMIEIDGLSGTLKFLEETDWAALLPFAAVHDELNRSNLRINTIIGNEIGIEYFVAQIATEYLHPAAQAFIEMSAAALEQITARYHATATSVPSV